MAVKLKHRKMKKLKLLQLLVVACIFILSSCSKNDDEPGLVPKNYVLVHGAWQAPYVWDAVKTNLEREGNHVTVVELPGHGSDQTPPQNISLETYKNKVVDAISHIDGKVILVGHSLGGIVISSVAEQIPAKIEKLVYVAAYLPISGQSLQTLSGMDANSQLNPLLGNLIFTGAPTVDVKQDQIVNIFIQDGTPAIQNLVLQNYRAEPIAPLNTPVTLTAANFGSVEKFYIKTLQDHALTPALQDQMTSATSVKSIYKLNTSHSPFLSKPDSLSLLLVKIAR
jgi:pimeloyl-ACP methyl ester carboxylesterase